MLERRVEALENDVRDMKSSLSRLEVGFARMEEKLAHLATGADIANIRESVARVEGRLSQIPSTWQIVGILAALLFGVASVVYATNTFLAQRPAASAAQTNVQK
jgi:hypothetical protein